MPREPQSLSAAVLEPPAVRATLAALLSLVVPGAGQVALGAWRRGLVMLAVTLALLMAALYGLHASGMLLELLVRPVGVAGLLVGNLALAAFRVYAAFDAFRTGVPSVKWPASSPALRLASGVVGVLAVVTLVPHGLTGHYSWVAHSTLRGMFAPAQSGASADPDGGLAATVSAGDPDMLFDDEGALLDAGSALAELDRLTVAVLGSDAAPGRPGHRLDAMMVVSVETATGRTSIFSVERHMSDFPLPDRLADSWERRCRDAGAGWDLLNALYRCGDEVIGDELAAHYPDAGDPAAAAVADTLGTLLGLPVEHYVMVDMAGFVALVDALGGVEVEIGPPHHSDAGWPRDEQACDWGGFDVEPDTRHLDGPAALELVRERTGTYEADRMGRQRCLMITLADQVDAPTLLRRFGELAGVFREHVVTSVPLDELPALASILSRVEPGEIETVGFGLPDYVRADASPHVERIREHVERSLEPSGRR